MAIAKATIPGLTNGTEYGVRLFVEGKFGYQTALEGATAAATPRAGQPASVFPVGTELLFPFDISERLFLIVHTYTDRVIVCQKYVYGSSTVTMEGLWGNSPVRASYNGAEYFNKLSTKVRNNILLSDVPTYSYSAKKNVISRDRVFFASTTEMGLGQIYGGDVEGTPFKYFATAAERIAKDADNQTAKSYRTRSLTSNSDNSTWCLVDSSGKNIITMTNNNELIARPFFAISPEMLFSLEPNPDGSYSPIL